MTQDLVLDCELLGPTLKSLNEKIAYFFCVSSPEIVPTQEEKEVVRHWLTAVLSCNKLPATGKPHSDEDARVRRQVPIHFTKA